MEESKISLADQLAIERTRMANERTLLAYFRTFIILISSGIAIIKLDFLNQINLLGIILISFSPLVLVFGVYRYYSLKRKIKSFIQYN